MRNHASIVKILVQAGAEVDLRDKINSFTPLHLSVDNQHLSVISALLDLNADPNAVRKRKKMIEGEEGGRRGREEDDYEDDYEDEDGDGDEDGDVHDDEDDADDIRGKRSNRRNREEEELKEEETEYLPPLYDTVTRDREYSEFMIEKLIQAGANIEGIGGGDTKKMTPLHYACAFGSDERTIQVLIEQGANIFARGPGGQTPLHMAVHGILCIYESDLNLPVGDEVNAMDDNGETPLFKACAGGIEGAAAWLIKWGANPDIANNDGIKPSEIALKNGFDSCAIVVKACETKVRNKL